MVSRHPPAGETNAGEACSLGNKNALAVVCDWLNLAYGVESEKCVFVGFDIFE